MFVTGLALAGELLWNRQVRVHLSCLYLGRGGRASLTIFRLTWRPITLIFVQVSRGNLRLLLLLGERVSRDDLLFLDFDDGRPFLALLPGLLGVGCGGVLGGHLAQISLLV